MTSGSLHRNTIFVEEAEIIAHDAHPGDQYVLRVLAPLCATKARPGSFAHVTCSPLLPMRRPLSIMRTHDKEGWVEFLYKAVGQGTRLLARCRIGERVNLMGPIGEPFRPTPEQTRPLLIGGGVGIPPMVFLADTMRGDTNLQPLVLIGSESPFPFTDRPSRFRIAGVPAQTIAAMPLLEDWGIPSRLASLQGYPGCFNGYVTDLARVWLDQLAPSERNLVEIFACGPHPMLEATARLARHYGVPCQVSLEEFMACAVGGCAGCVVPVHTSDGLTMKRVCVDGPVFDAAQVFPP